jgi:hypothetical protein
MPANRFDQLIEEWWPRIRDAFYRGIRAIKSFVQVGRIADRLEKGDVEGAIRAVGIEPVAFRDLEKTIENAFETAGKFVALKIPGIRDPDGLRLKVQFDVRNPRAETILRDQSSTLVKEIVDDQRTMIRQALQAGMEAGRNPRDVALDLVGRINPQTGQREGGAIGLTASQENWTRNYELELQNLDSNALQRTLRDKRFDRTVARAIRDKTPIPVETRQKMVAAYRNRALQYRAEAIARTEALTSMHQAAQEAMQQAIDKGQVDEAAVTKVWHSAADNRVRDTHRSLNGQEVQFRADFISPSGAHLQFPGDSSAPASEVVNCRCWADYKTDFLRGLR